MTMYLGQKRRICVTLDIECYDDLNLEDVDWNNILMLESDESVEVKVREVDDDIW